MLNVLVTMPFTDAQIERLRRVSPSLDVKRADAEHADYSRTDVLYAGAPPRDLSRAPRLQWVQLHMAGVNALADHPIEFLNGKPAGLDALVIHRLLLTGCEMARQEDRHALLEKAGTREVRREFRPLRRLISGFFL